MFADHFVKGGYVGIGWPEIDHDLGSVRSRDELYPVVRAAYPEIQSNIVIGNYVGQIHRFLLEIQPGDYVITPNADKEHLHFGKIESQPRYYFTDSSDGCRYRHRRPVKWDQGILKRGDFSVPFQKTITSWLTVYAIAHRDEFFQAIGKQGLLSKPVRTEYDSYRVVLDRILELDDKEFEILVGHLLTALGFDGAEVTGKSGDGGVDVKGKFNVSNLATVTVFLQAKRYKLGTKIAARTVKELRQSIPKDGQGAFITTADYQDKATDVALDPNFPRIGLINGRQLVDLLVENWADIPAEFRERLGLRPGLVRD
jgi:restriction system protein